MSKDHEELQNYWSEYYDHENQLLAWIAFQDDVSRAQKNGKPIPEFIKKVGFHSSVNDYKEASFFLEHGMTQLQFIGQGIKELEASKNSNTNNDNIELDSSVQQAQENGTSMLGSICIIC